MGVVLSVLKTLSRRTVFIIYAILSIRNPSYDKITSTLREISAPSSLLNLQINTVPPANVILQHKKPADLLKIIKTVADIRIK